MSSLFLFKKITTAFILASFLMIALFSPYMMSTDGRMSGNCPFSVNRTSLCPQGALALAIHHISAYHSFFNVFVNSGITAIIFTLLLALSAILILSISPLLFRPLAIIGRLHDFPPAIPRNKKITRWLSLLENSPSSA
ncbi:MAG: hypothetical protein CEO19_283 [Parcubacteria group bacterium Gr01-1014_73]|nr:MAG: hypothetical protein CEO19_283 [Parcubacteria group bacterium Gr01-1014_73]